MNHKDYFQFIEYIYKLVAQNRPSYDDPLAVIFQNGGNYHVSKYQVYSADIQKVELIVDPRCTPSNGTIFSMGAMINFYILNNDASSHCLENREGLKIYKELILSFPDRTEHEDNYFKLKIGKHYKDAVLLYTRLHEAMHSTIGGTLWECPHT